MISGSWSLPARQVYALLRTLLDWVPGPSGSRAHSLPGFVQRERWCEQCRVDGPSEGCRFCGGSGVVTVADPMQVSTRVSRMLGDEKQAREDARHARDRTIERLGGLIREHDGVEAPDDALTRAVGLRDRQYRRGDYALLERTLDMLAAYSPAWHEVAMGIVQQPFVEAPVEPPVTWLKVGAVCEWLALRMVGLAGGRELRVPAGVPVFGREELEAQSRLAKDALARGASGWASLSRRERKRLIVELHEQGLPDGRIAARFGLSRGYVQRLRAGIVGALDESNGQEEAA